MTPTPKPAQDATPAPARHKRWTCCQCQNPCRPWRGAGGYRSRCCGALVTLAYPSTPTTTAQKGQR